MDNEFSPKKGFFREADKGKGGGAVKDDENQSNSNDEQKDKLAEAVGQSQEIIEQLIPFEDVLEVEDPEIFKERRDEFNSLNLSSKIESLKRRLLFAKGRQTLEDKDKSDKIEALSRDIELIENLHQTCSAIFSEGVVSTSRSKTELKGEKEEGQLNPEKQERHEVLLERMEKKFIGINKYLQASKDLGIDLTEDEVKDLILDLKIVFSEFINPNIKKKIRAEIGSEKNSKSKRIDEDGVSDVEKSILQKEIDDLNALLSSPFTFIAESGFTNEQLGLIKQQYEKYVQEIEQLRGEKTPNEEQQINRAKKILGSDEFLDFMKKLRQLSNDCKKISLDELKTRYADIMSSWSGLSIRPGIFYKIDGLSYQGPDGQKVSGGDVFKQYKDLEKLRFDIERKLAEAGGEIKTFNFREIADEIIKRQLDLFRFGDRRNPSNELDEHKDYLDSAFKYWAFGSVFNNEHVVAEAILSLDVFNISLDEINLEVKTNLFKEVFEFFKLIHDGRMEEANDQKDGLINEVKSAFNLNEIYAEKWIIEAYKKVGRVELERLEIKAELQTFFMDDVLQTDGSAAGDRSQLQSNLESYLVGRNELLAATTYHPEYGWLVRKLLKDLQSIAVLKTNEVVVKRLVKKQNLYAFSKGEGEKSEFDYVETLQRVIAQPEDEFNAKQKGVPVAEYLKKKLEDMGETVMYLPDYKNNLIDYNNFCHSERGRTNLSNSINLLISKMEDDSELKIMLDELDKEDLEKAKMFTARFFTIFNSLDIVLAEKQKNTTTRSHNGAIEDVDRISLMDPEASMVHRMFRYPGNYSEATAEILAVMSPVNAEHNLYVGTEPNKEFSHEESYVYHKLNDRGELVDDHGKPIPIENHESVLKSVDSNYIYQLGKEGDVRNGKYVRADAMQLATVQRMQWEFYEQLFPIIEKMPLIRRRGFLEPLGFSTNQIVFMNPKDWDRGRKAEQVWDFINGSVDYKGDVVKKIEKIKDLLDLKKENVTELQHYNTAEKNGLLGILERMYATTSSGSRLSAEQLFSSNQSILHDWFKAWGRIKMYPSPIVRDAFVPMTYLMIRRAMVALESISGYDANFDEAQGAWTELINTLESNLRDRGGLDSYGAEIATLINLLCDQPAYRILEKKESGDREYERIGRFKFEELDRGDYKAEDYTDKEKYPEVGPKPNDFIPIKSRRSFRINYVISRFLYDSVLKTKPYVKVPRPKPWYNPFTGKRKEEINWDFIVEQLKGYIGDYSRLKAKLIRTFEGKKDGISTGPVISRKGDPLVQVKEDKK